jgi:hypothetical protein
LFLFVVQHFYECLTEDDAELWGFGRSFLTKNVRNIFLDFFQNLFYDYYLYQSHIIFEEGYVISA